MQFTADFGNAFGTVAVPQARRARDNQQSRRAPASELRDQFLRNSFAQGSMLRPLAPIFKRKHRKHDAIPRALAWTRSRPNSDDYQRQKQSQAQRDRSSGFRQPALRFDCLRSRASL